MDSLLTPGETQKPKIHYLKGEDVKKLWQSGECMMRDQQRDVILTPVEQYQAVIQYAHRLKRKLQMGTRESDNALCVAQARKIYAWGNEPCPHNKMFITWKRECPICWEELRGN